MRYRTLYELMDMYEDDAVELGEDSPVDTDRVLKMTMARLGPQAVADRRGRRPARTALRIGLIAAAVAAAMSVTAYAVYQATVSDYIIPEEAGTEQAEAPAARLSLVGYQGTAEYEASVEWSAWQEKNPPDFSAVGNDDSYYETPKNYAALYDAPFKAQAEKLDQIMAKYGLAPLEDMCSIYAPEEVYDALGTDPFLPEGSWGGGYLYNDGTFKLEAIDFGTEDLNGTLFVSCKGSFARIFGGVPADYEEWSYTAASGQTVDLVMGTNGALMLLETEGAYIHLSVDMGSAYTRADLEKLADSVGFDVLAERFDGSVTREQATEDFYAFIRRREGATDTCNRRGEADEAIAALGDYYLADLPDGYFMYIVSGYTREPGVLDETFAERRYEGPGGEIVLIWSDDPALSEVLPLVENDDGTKVYPDREQITVNGCQARLLTAENEDYDDFGEIEWFDEALGLRFVVNGFGVDRDALISAAQSVRAR